MPQRRSYPFYQIVLMCALALLGDGGDRRKLLRAYGLRISESVKAVLKRTGTHFELFKTELTAGEKSC